MTAIVIVVFCCSIIQSVAGIGLLVFGTPCLLILGVPFGQALVYLLPCSAVISAMQVFAQRPKFEGLQRDFFFFGLPLTVVGLAFTLYAGHQFNVKVGVGVMLIISAILRFSPRYTNRLQDVVKSFRRPLIAITGLVHGLTNMGGGLIVIIVSSAFRDKESIRSNVAMIYLIFALIQLATLFASGSYSPLQIPVVLPLIAFFSYVLLGRRVFNWVNQGSFQMIMTGVIFFFGLSLILTNFIK
jgi:uncharacterized protein